MEFFAEHPQFTHLIVVALIAIVTFFGKRELLRMENRIEKLETGQKEMKDNYIKRFDEQKNLLMEIKTTLAIVGTKLDAQKEFCEKVQRAKQIT